MKRNPLFRLQIVDAQDQVVVSPFAAGRVEIDLIESCVRNIVARGVGMFRSEATVTTAIREGITEVIQALKDETFPLVK